MIGIGAGAGAADGQVLGEEILEFGDAGLAHRDADADLVISAGNPVESLRIEGIALADEERIESDAAADRADRGAVMRRHAVEIIGKTQAAGAFEVLRHQRRIAGNMPAEMPADHPRIKVISAADAVADIKVDGAALVEIAHRVGESRAERNQTHEHGQCGGLAGDNFADRRLDRSEPVDLVAHSSSG